MELYLGSRFLGILYAYISVPLPMRESRLLEAQCFSPSHLESVTNNKLINRGWVVLTTVSYQYKLVTDFK